MVTILCKEKVFLILEEQAKQSGVPWAILKKPLLGFIDSVRDKGLFLVEVSEPKVINMVQEAITVEDKNVQIGPVIALTRLNAKKILEIHGKEKFESLWDLAKDSVMKFIDHLYANNIITVQAVDDASKTLVLEKSGKHNLHLNIKLPE